MTAAHVLSGWRGIAAVLTSLWRGDVTNIACSTALSLHEMASSEGRGGTLGAVKLASDVVEALHPAHWFNKQSAGAACFGGAPTAAAVSFVECKRGLAAARLYLDNVAR